MVNKLAMLVMIAGVVGFALHYIGVIFLLPETIWAGIAVVGIIATVLTRRAGN